MPAIMDMLCGPGTALAAWMRSWLPQINRFGQSIPQLLVANRLRMAEQKKYCVAICSGIMGGSFLVLGLIWSIFGGSPDPFLRVSFLILYGVFFICVGINNLAFNTLQGKLVQYNFRGRFFLFANTVGGILAIAAAWWLLPTWLDFGANGVVYVFVFSGACFVFGGLVALSCKELPVGAKAAPGQSTLRQKLWLPVKLFRQNREFRYLAFIAACFGTSMVLFPHYQALYRSTVDESEFSFSLRDLVWWVILQNAGTVVISWCAGPAADRFGYRIVLRLILLLLGLAPLLAIWLSQSVDWTLNYYLLVFLLVGVTPITIRVLNNFALELAPSHEHPQFLSALSLCIAAPVIIFSQFIGLLLPILGYYPIFVGISGIVFVGWLLTFFVTDPRERLTNDVVENDNHR